MRALWVCVGVLDASMLFIPEANSVLHRNENKEKNKNKNSREREREREKKKKKGRSKGLECYQLNMTTLAST